MQPSRRVNNGSQMDNVMSGHGEVINDRYGKGQVQSEMKNRNSEDHVNQEIMHETIKPVEKWDKIDTNCIRMESRFCKKLISNKSTHHQSSVFGPASPSVTAKTVPARKPEADCAKDHIHFGEPASPMQQSEVQATGRPQAIDHVDAVLHSIPLEAKKERQGSEEEMKNKNKATEDHISGILAAPKPKVSAGSNSYATCISSKGGIIGMEIRPSDRSSETRGNTGKRIITTSQRTSSAVPYEANRNQVAASKGLTRNHNQSSILGNEENAGNRQITANVGTANVGALTADPICASRQRMLGSHVLGSNDRDSTPVKHNKVRTSSQTNSNSMGNIFKWG